MWYMRRKSILQCVTQTQVSVIIEDAYFSPFQGPIILSVIVCYVVFFIVVKSRFY